jgi:folylpolyglutamate synthase/dihydropteroate synthase
MLQMLSRYFDEIRITDIQYERAARVEEIIEVGKKLNITVIPVIEHSKFVNSFTTRPTDECLVVVGSMYLLGEIKQQLLVGVA